jgi:hypothetical protein
MQVELSVSIPRTWLEGMLEYLLGAVYARRTSHVACANAAAKVYHSIVPSTRACEQRRWANLRWAFQHQDAELLGRELDRCPLAAAGSGGDVPASRGGIAEAAQGVGYGPNPDPRLIGRHWRVCDVDI